MGTKYSTNAASGYNTVPPPDGGETTEANKVKWSVIKDKLADPVKDRGDNIDSDLLLHFDRGPIALSTNTTIAVTHFNEFLEVSGTIDLTMTDASTLGDGFVCDFINTDTANSQTIKRATSTDTINGVTANITVPPLSALRILVNTAGNGFLTGNQLLRTANAFTSIQKWSKGADLTNADVSANVLTVGTDGNYFDYSGSSQINEIASFGIGATIKIHFDGAVVLQHNATNLFLPSGENITTVAGDELEFTEYASGDCRVTGGNLARVATKAEMEAATSLTVAVPPGRTKNHPGVVKAWVMFSISGGTPSIDTDYNVTSLTDNGLGDYDINLTTDFSGVNYCPFASSRWTSGDIGYWANAHHSAAGVIKTKHGHISSSTYLASDPLNMYVGALGDQ